MKNDQPSAAALRAAEKLYNEDEREWFRGFTLRDLPAMARIIDASWEQERAALIAVARAASKIKGVHGMVIWKEEQDLEESLSALPKGILE